MCINKFGRGIKKDLSFLKKLPQQPRVPELLRVSQDSGMGQESPRESQNAPDEASDALESNIDEHVYAFMVEECVLLGMISHKNSLITIFGHKHKIKNFIKFTGGRSRLLVIGSTV